MKRKTSLYPCEKCVHNHFEGCCYQIDKNISCDYISKKGSHFGCFLAVNDLTAEELQRRRKEAKEQRLSRIK